MSTRVAIGLVIAAAVVSLGTPAAASAAPFDVNTTADHAEDKSCTAPSDCTLRDALSLAGSADTINVPAGVYALDGALGELRLTADHIVGAGARSTFIQGTKSRVLLASTGGSTVAGVTIRNGNGVSSVSSGSGGGVFVAAEATLILSDSTISGNTATSGGGIAGAGGIGLVGSTVSGNTASAGRLTQGGGIAARGALAMTNSTVSGNTAADSTPGGTSSQGGGVWAGAGMNLQNVTIASNSASQGGGLYLQAAPAGVSQSWSNTLVGGNKTGDCAGTGLSADATHNNLGPDACLLAGAGDVISTAPALGALANNGGATDTQALLPASPAINAGATCASTDQRGVARPQPAGGACDIGAYEYRAPTLTVTTAVINDAGGTLTPAGVTAHVLVGKADVAGSPQPGDTTGTTYTLVAGTTYTVIANAVAGYTRTVGVNCASTGNITLLEGQNRTCQITLEDIAPTLKVTTSVINDNGGTLTAAKVVGHVRIGSGADVGGSPQPGSAAGATYTLSAGTFNVGADAVRGYTLTVGPACAANGDVTLALADAKTCTITANDVAPQLTVTTVVDNGANGTATPADFSVHVRSGTTEAPGSPQPGDTTGTPYTLAAGGYGVSADGVPGYSVAGSGDCDANGAISLAVGDVKACKLTATAGAPTLRVVTQVVNDNGGSLAPSGLIAHVRRAGADVTGSPQLGNSAGTPYSLSIGGYVVGADPVAGYTLAVSGQCASSGGVTLATGDDKTCTITADDVAPKLTVLTTVVNDNGGIRAPSGFTVHVRRSGADVAGSPKPGSSSGTTYTVTAGTYTVGSDAVTGYTTAVGGGCAANGTVTLTVGQSKTCTVAANDKAPVKSALPPPVAHRSANLVHPTGPVTIKLPGTTQFVPLTGDAQVPLGTTVNVKKGRITLIAAADKNGGTASADFYGGIFKLGQSKGGSPITVLTLVEKLTGCKAKGKATIARKKKRKRRLWGDGHGRFQTKGRHSAATVVGTKWLVEDRCTSTLTRVARGKVKVRDFVKKKTVIVRKGHRYIARAR